MLQKEEVFERLKLIISDLLKISQQKNVMKNFPEIHTETDLIDDLGVDSVETLDLIAKIEQEFNINIDDAAKAASVRKVGELVDYIAALMKKKEKEKTH